jgi:hypothetical protein
MENGGWYSNFSWEDDTQTGTIGVAEATKLRASKICEISVTVNSTLSIYELLGFEKTCQKFAFSILFFTFEASNLKQ